MRFLRIATRCALLSAIGLLPNVAAAEGSADANNPLADVRAFNIQGYYLGDFSGMPDSTDGYQAILRYAQPLTFGDTNWLMRASVPYNSLPVGGGGTTISGIGDIDVFLAYQFDTKPGISFGIGPQVVAPTASDDRLGADQWQLGVANVYFNGTSPKFQWGYLLIYRTGIGSTPAGRTRPEVGAFQPFWFYQLGQGWYTGGAPIWTYDFATDNYNVPFGLRLGKVQQRGKVTANYFIEPQWSLASRGDGLPEFQLYAAVNLQFR